jgi:hypothetical protein
VAAVVGGGHLWYVLSEYGCAPGPVDPFEFTLYGTLSPINELMRIMTTMMTMMAAAANDMVAPKAIK